MTDPAIRRVHTVDYHTGGEPFRIVAAPPVEIPGTTVADRRMNAIADAKIDGLRQLLCFEPRGHADMYGGMITAADDEGAHFGVLFWHKDGFSTACGHGTIALGAWAVQSGRVPIDGSCTDVVIDVPSGRVTARVHTDAGRVTAVDFVNVASYAIATDVPVPTGRGEVAVDVSFGGAIYASIDAATLGLTVSPECLPDLIAIGREIKWALNDSDLARHPSDSRLSGIYGTIVYADLGNDAGGNVHQRNVTIFADGEVDRSPCGSGTCARVALLAADGRLSAGARLIHDSIVGSRFEAAVLSQTEVDGRDAVIVRVTGMAYRTGEHTFEVAADDPLVPGFVLQMTEPLPFVTAEQIATLVSPAEAVEAIIDALRDADPADDPPRSVIDVGTGQLLLMPSASDAAIGVKLATVAPDNPAAGLPRIHAVYALFDARTLVPLAVLDGAALTTLRTPAVSVAAVRPALLARADAPRVVVFGAGPQGVGHVATLRAVLDLADVTYIVRNPRGRDRMLAAGSEEALAVLRAADVVVCATTARTPLFDSTLLTDDAIVIAIGSHEPDARELDSALMGRAQVVVEDIATALRECGDVVLAIADDTLTPDALVTMRDMVGGAAAPSADRPIVFKGSGMAWQDLAVATRIQVASISHRAGLGDTTSLPG